MPWNEPLTTPQYLTTREVAKLLRLGERKIYELASAGDIPVSRVGGKLLFPRSLIEQWVIANVDFSQGSARHTPRPLVFAGSHDPLLEWALRASNCEIATFFDGSANGLDRLAGGKAIAAGCHIPETDNWNVDALRNRAPGAPVVLLEWARRCQGLIVRPEDERRYQRLAALRGKVVVPRQIGAGSRLLFDRLLADAGIDAAELRWTESVAHSESDVAMAVGAGEADAGFAIEAAAKQMSLAFIPLAEERYDIAVWRPAFFDAPFQKLWNFCYTQALRTRAQTLGGYQLDGFGTVHFNGP